MTVIELFDESKTENIISILCEKYDRIVFVGDKTVMNDIAAENAGRFVKNNFPEIQFSFVYPKADDVKSAVEALDDIITEYGDCCFEATGGSDAVLIAVGIISERYNLPIINYDVRNPGKVTKRLSLHQVVELNGGVVEDFENNIRTADSVLRKDVSFLWRMGRNDPEFWIKGGKLLGECQAHLSGLKVHIRNRTLREFESVFLNKLSSAGFIEELQTRNNTLTFYYRDDKIRRILIKAGNLLELVTFFAVYSRIPESDVYRGVTLVHESESPDEFVRNEVDVMFMQGLQPVFVSCKAGNISKDALYELETVATRFGGKYAKKMLVTGCIRQNCTNYEYFEKRAKSMGITLIDNVYEKTIDGLGEEILAAISV
jgi:hypothetical protein